MVGIYEIACTANNKVYIGQSTDIEKRWKDHLLRLKEGKHINQHLQYSWNKYSASCFVFKIIEECIRDFKLLNEREIFWITKLCCLDKNKGFNISSGGGNAYSLSGKTEEEKREIFRKVGITRTLKYSNINAPNYGKPMTDEQKIKISNSLKGEKNPNYGTKRTEHSNLMKGAGNPRSRKILCLTTNEVFDCAKYAGQKYNTTNSNILKCCRNKQKFAGHTKNGLCLVWQYYEDTAVVSGGGEKQ